MIYTRCRQCHKPLSHIRQQGGRQFCSKHCKNESQKKHITLVCRGCFQKFDIRPHLKRSANYCSVSCYQNSTRVKEKRLCKICHKEFYAKRPLIKKGFGIYCSRECLHLTYPKRIKKLCVYCKKAIFVQPSKVHLVKFCSKKCKDDYSRDYVERICKNCHKHFQLPSWETKKGKGLFCSKHCFLQYKGESFIEKKVRYALQRAHIKFLQEVKIDKYRADFFLPQHNFVIECDGDYWHKIPGIKVRDKRKDSLLLEHGYSIIRFTEKEIRKTDIVSLSEKISHIAGLPLLSAT